MACYSPLVGYRLPDGSVTFSDRGRGDEILLPCGQCVGCRLERSRQWAVRCVHESKMHAENCFITLTYNDENLPRDMSLNHEHFQRFMKRLRKAFAPRKFSFYMCGEYGENFGRPHYHACLFGLDFPDRKSLKRLDSGFFLYTSDILSKLWPYGFSSVSDFSFETAAYTARYIMKKVTGDAAKEHYRFVSRETGEIYDRVPEYCRMSLRPAIGARWFARYGKSDVLTRDAVVINGVEATVPRYYDKLTRRLDRELYEEIKCKRELDNYPSRYDNSDTRLDVKRQVTEARISSLKRKI